MNILGINEEMVNIYLIVLFLNVLKGKIQTLLDVVPFFSMIFRSPGVC